MASCNAAVDSEERKEIFVSSLRLSKCGIQFVDLNCNEQDSLSSSPSLSLPFTLLWWNPRGRGEKMWKCAPSRQHFPECGEVFQVFDNPSRNYFHGAKSEYRINVMILTIERNFFGNISFLVSSIFKTMSLCSLCLFLCIHSQRILYVYTTCFQKCLILRKLSEYMNK